MPSIESIGSLPQAPGERACSVPTRQGFHSQFLGFSPGAVSKLQDSGCHNVKCCPFVHIVEERTTCEDRNQSSYWHCVGCGCNWRWRRNRPKPCSSNRRHLSHRGNPGPRCGRHRGCLRNRGPQPRIGPAVSRCCRRNSRNLARIRGGHCHRGTDPCVDQSRGIRSGRCCRAVLDCGRAVLSCKRRDFR